MVLKKVLNNLKEGISYLSTKTKKKTISKQPRRTVRLPVEWTMAPPSVINPQYQQVEQTEKVQTGSA